MGERRGVGGKLELDAVVEDIGEESFVVGGFIEGAVGEGAGLGESQEADGAAGEGLGEASKPVEGLSISSSSSWICLE
jgi:hypothetical protein